MEMTNEQQCAQIEREMDAFGLDVVVVGPNMAGRLRQIGFNMDRVTVADQLPVLPCLELHKADPMMVGAAPKGPRGRWGRLKR